MNASATLLLWTFCCAPLLQTLLVSRCNFLTEVIPGDFGNGATEEYPDLFSNLTNTFLVGATKVTVDLLASLAISCT